MISRYFIFAALISMPAASYAAGAVKTYVCAGNELGLHGKVNFDYIIERLTGTSLVFNSVEQDEEGAIGLKAGTEIAVDAIGRVSFDGVPVGIECSRASEKFSERKDGSYSLHFEFSCGAQDHLDIQATCVQSRLPN